jgi:hypothetical protein
MINLAAECARGDWVLLTDTDCLFDTSTVAQIIQCVTGHAQRILYGERRHLCKKTMQAILDAVRDFRKLATQQCHRSRSGTVWIL